MKLSEFKKALAQVETLRFQQLNGTWVAAHFHITEIGTINKKFIDCGGTIRKEERVNFQLWSAEDLEHRLSPKKLMRIIELAEQHLAINDVEIEVEYQANTIGKYGLEYKNNYFVLTTTQTDCLAKDNCGIPTEKPKIKLSEIQQAPTCTPGSGCC